MKDFIEEVLKATIEITDYRNYENMSLFYRNNYKLNQIKLYDIVFILAEPLEENSVVILCKQHRQLEHLTSMRCALYLRKLNYYAKDVLLKNGIPFILEDKQMYLPFLGILLSKQTERTIKQCQQISFLTQKLLLTALYENWQHVNVTKAAERLDVSKNSITKCFDELQAIEFPYLNIKSKTRVFSCNGTKKEMWNIILPYMRNPLICQYELEEEIDTKEKLSGMSALSYYSTLEDNSYKTYAVTKKDLSRLQLKKRKRIPNGEIPKCVIQEIGYRIDFGEQQVVDPLTVYLLIGDEEKEDPRVEIAIDEMLEEYVWSKE